MHLSLCICALLPRLEARTRVVLLLHQLEVDKPTNTGVVAARCLVNSAIVYRGRAPGHRDADAVAAPRDDDDEATDDGIEAQAARIAAQIPAGTRAAFLFPHEAAQPLEAWREHAEPTTLVVPDGTWRQASRARGRLAAALGLPCVSLASVGREGTRLRAALRPGRLATIEALAHALGVLEGAEIEEALLHVFRVMTDRTLWSNGRLARDAVTGGVPDGARSHDPLGAATPGRRTLAAP
jgi:DTW domain-containing protein YfiP